MNRDEKLYLASAQVLGNAADEYSDDEIDTELTYPYWNEGNMEFGLNMIVTTTFTGLDSGAILWIVHGSSTAPTTKHTGMFIPVASLVKGKKFFVPMGKGVGMLRYARALFDIVNEVATAGAADVYFGPKAD
jgi:hypothetical protein